MLTKYGVYQMMADLNLNEIAKAFKQISYVIRDEI